MFVCPLPCLSPPPGAFQCFLTVRFVVLSTQTNICISKSHSCLKPILVSESARLNIFPHSRITQTFWIAMLSYSRILFFVLK